MSVFISYRRADTGYVTDRIYEYLIAECDEEAVFRDLDSIPLGRNFRQAIAERLANCDVLLAVIGSQWLSVADSNGRRLDNPHDFVRVEIETALARGIPVIPVLVDGVSVPDPSDVPQGLVDLCEQQAILLRGGRDFVHDMERLIHSLRTSGYLRMTSNEVSDDHPFGLLGMF